MDVYKTRLDCSELSPIFKVLEAWGFVRRQYFFVEKFQLQPNGAQRHAIETREHVIRTYARSTRLAHVPARTSITRNNERQRVSHDASTQS